MASSDMAYSAPVPRRSIAAAARHLDPTNLRLFRAAVEERSLAKASEREAIALSAASRRITELEYRLGTPLLHRHDRGVTPTAAGEVLLKHVATLFDVLDRIGTDMDAFASGARGQVRLFANMSAISGVLPEALAGFLPAHPGIQLILQERYSDDILHGLQTGIADVGLIAGTVQAPDLHLQPWREDRLVVVLPVDHPLGAMEVIALQALDGVPFVGQPAETALQKLYRQKAAALGMTLNEQVNVSGFDGVRRMVEAGLGVAILPAAVAAPYVGTMRILVRPLAEDWAVRQLMLCTRDPASLPAAAKVLIAYLTRPGLG